MFAPIFGFKTDLFESKFLFSFKYLCFGAIWSTSFQNEWLLGYWDFFQMLSILRYFRKILRSILGGESLILSPLIQLATEQFKSALKWSFFADNDDFLPKKVKNLFENMCILTASKNSNSTGIPFGPDKVHLRS